MIPFNYYISQENIDLAVNKLWQRQCSHHFADDIFKCNSVHTNVGRHIAHTIVSWPNARYNCYSLIQMSLTFASERPINNKLALAHLDDILAPNRRPTILWTDDGLVCCRMYTSLAFINFNHAITSGFRTQNWHHLDWLSFRDLLWYKNAAIMTNSFSRTSGLLAVFRV